MDKKVEHRPEDAPGAKNLVKPYSGYEKNHVPAHDPLLTETDADTPMGEYMRRFWHPICMSEELTDTPHYLVFLGEELVAFRDKSGEVGVLHAHCCHRGASLEYGMIQEKGIMCSYHGWVYDVDGTCLEVPAPTGEEEEAEKFRKSVCQGAYKAFERHGLVFAYMGPAEEAPPFPEWESDFSVHPDDELVPFSNFQHCNWLQVQDNAADQYHHIPLHTTAVVPGHEQGTTFGEAGAAPYLVRPDLQFFPVHNGTGMAWTSSRRVDDEKIFIRVNHQALPNLSFHSYLFEDGTEKKHFSRLHMIRWTVSVDDTNSKMIGWRVVGKNIDPREVGTKHLIGYETIDFLEGQVAMRRPERATYGQGEKPPIPKDHRDRDCYKDAQYAPGDYEVIITQRPIAVHALERPMKADGGVYLFRKLLREAVNGGNKDAAPEAIREWLKSVNATPNSYCSGHVLEVPAAETLEDEVKRRRDVARAVIDVLHDSDELKGAERTKMVTARLEEIEKTVR
ncbi:MAG: Rieske 2Fe-2S domain-containing protein [Rhodospirillaceae bacterium]|nr:Rieske 2Fe-2S domain-containing protein [Rhodospirillaceae bacterium]